MKNSVSKKQYTAPRLNKIGKVSKLTLKGGSTNDGTPEGGLI